MGTQEALTRPRRRGVAEVETCPAETTLPVWAFLAVAAGGSAVLLGLSRSIFLFWDDFVFLGQARDADLTRAYLGEPLFSHFSPVTRFLNWLVAGHVAAHPWLIPLMVWSLVVLTVFASVWLMVVLHGRTPTALVGSLLLAPSLALVQLGNWWTAAANILPALAACALAFGSAVQVVRGRSRWWIVPCLMAVAVGVLDYELPMLMPGYIGLWVLLFKDRVVDEPLVRLLRRTWLLWAGLVALALVALWNYRFNYYDEVDRPGVGDLVHALGRSLFRTLVPTLLGFHDPRTGWFSTLSLVVGVLAVAGGSAWLLVTRSQAWRGLLFAGSGWLLPTLALALNRVSLFGVTVVDNIIYFYLPVLLVVVGVLEAYRAPRRASPTRATPTGPHPAVRWAVPSLVVVVVAAYSWSAGPTQRYQLPPGASPDYVAHARSSAERLLERGGPLNVVNGDVPGSVVPEMFAPYNRVANVLGLTVPGPIRYDAPEEPYYAVSEDGELQPATIVWEEGVEPSKETMRGQLRLHQAEHRTLGDEGLCFRTTAETQLVWTPLAPVAGNDLVLRSLARAGRPTPVVAVVAKGEDVPFDRANLDNHMLGPRRPGTLDTIAADVVGRVKLVGFGTDVRVCVSSLALGHVQDT